MKPAATNSTKLHGHLPWFLLDLPPFKWDRGRAPSPNPVASVFFSGLTRPIRSNDQAGNVNWWWGVAMCRGMGNDCKLPVFSLHKDTCCNHHTNPFDRCEPLLPPALPPSCFQLPRGRSRGFHSTIFSYLIRIDVGVFRNGDPQAFSYPHVW